MFYLSIMFSIEEDYHKNWLTRIDSRSCGYEPLTHCDNFEVWCLFVDSLAIYHNTFREAAIDDDECFHKTSLLPENPVYLWDPWP